MKISVERFNAQSLAGQFLQVGGLVSLLAMMAVGWFVTNQIVETVTQTTATNSAMYVDSIIAPLLPDMRNGKALDDSIVQALDETLGQGALGGRLVSFKLWNRDGTILYAKDKSMVGKKFDFDDQLKLAWTGKVVATFNQLDEVESVGEKAMGKPLLEIYNPVLQPWSGEVVAVSEFYEVANDFQQALQTARIWSWLTVMGITAGFFTLLFTIVSRGSRTIDGQKQALVERVRELSSLVTQNRQLHQRVQRASQRTTALNESYLRRIGADLHDGPAQLIALASLRLDSKTVTDVKTPKGERLKELQTIRKCMDTAMLDIRGICNGLVLPHIENLTLSEISTLAVSEHKHRTGKTAELTIQETTRPLSTPEKICVYRFIQEALNNAYKHSGNSLEKVTLLLDANRQVIEVRDNGRGFDTENIGLDRLGLSGMRERIESLGGNFEMSSSPAGTWVRILLSVEEHVES